MIAPLNRRALHVGRRGWGGVKNAESNVIDREYTYQNDAGFDVLKFSYEYQYWNFRSRNGYIKFAQHIGVSGSYLLPEQSATFEGYVRKNNRGDSATVMNMRPGKLRQLFLRTGEQFYYENSHRNFVISSRTREHTGKHYVYGARGNLIKEISIYQPPIWTEHLTECPDGILYCNEVVAKYPDTCSDLGVNSKTCNKPIWIRDPRGNQTDFTYHLESGQLATVTGPAVTVDGIEVRPKTTYTYEKMFAYYKKDSNIVERADTGIWLLKTEFKCLTSNATESWCQAGDSDKIQKEYYYGPQDGSPNNLFLRGESTTAGNYWGNVSTRVTCYSYDQYGNRVGQIGAKGNSNLTSCR